ncbi:MAG: hypothetical protein ACREIA_03470, partial [Opitutaceae bacterium]
PCPRFGHEPGLLTFHNAQGDLRIHLQSHGLFSRKRKILNRKLVASAVRAASAIGSCIAV